MHTVAEVSVLVLGRKLVFTGHPDYVGPINGSDLSNAPVAVLGKRLPTGAAYLDVGANVGLTAIPLAAQRPDLQITAFEPVPSNAELLRRNIHINGIKNVEVIEVAVGNKKGTLYIDDKGPWSTASATGVSGVAVATMRLDDLVHERVAFLKIDVEGHEPNVFDGARRILQNCAPLMFVEFNSWCLLTHRYDPLSFAEAIYSSFIIEGVLYADRHVSIPTDALAFLHANITQHGCVTDLIMLPQKQLPSLVNMTRPP
jgi:FkbM family methyltransferase